MRMFWTLILLFATILLVNTKFFNVFAGASWVALQNQKNYGIDITRITASIRGMATVLLLLLVTSNQLIAQFEIPVKPKKIEEQTSMYDYAEMFSIEQRKLLEQKLLNYADSTSTQMVVITINNLKGEYIGELAPKWAHKWGIGQKGIDNGLLILIAKEDRKVWIAPGYGIEEVLTAGRNGTIIRHVITPNFKKGLYYNGVNEALDVIRDMLLGRYTPPEPQPKKTSLLPLFIFFGFIGLMIYLSVKYGDKMPRNNNGGGSPFSDGPIILSRSGRQHWTSGGFGSGGGFSSGRGGGFSGGFGGGGFSGGGAGGSW